MTNGYLSGPAPHVGPQLRNRIPGQTVMAETLRIQGQAPPRGRLRKVLGTNPLLHDAAPWYQGALGEVAVGRAMDRLGPEWTVLHAVPVGAGQSDIDHVLIGPAGVFTLNTKNHSGQNVSVAGRTFMVSGHRQDHLRTASHEAIRAAGLLNRAVRGWVTVTAVLVIVNPQRLTVKEHTGDVQVLTADTLVPWLQQLPPVLASEEVRLLGAAASDPATWKTDAVFEDPAEVARSFEALQREIGQARLRSLLWRGAALVTAFSPLVGFLP